MHEDGLLTLARLLRESAEVAVEAATRTMNDEVSKGLPGVADAR